MILNFSQKMVLFCILSFFTAFSQNKLPNSQNAPKQKSEFWKKVQFGGGIGIGAGSGYTNFSLAPSAIYNVNQYFSMGVGVQGSYISSKSNNTYAGYKSTVLGGSLIFLGNPIKEIQLSAELEELNFNTKFDTTPTIKENFWNTALFLGAGYRTDNVIFGVRYNVLYNDNNNAYNTAWMPFVRAYF
jgi:hypothetical protein